MILYQNNLLVKDLIVTCGGTCHDERTIKDHYEGNREMGYADLISQLKADSKYVPALKRLNKFAAITGNNNCKIFFGEIFSKKYSSIFGLYMTPNGTFLCSGTGYETHISAGKTLAGNSLSSISTNRHDSVFIDCKVNSEVIATYNFVEDTISIVDNTKLDNLNMINSFLTRFCNKSLKVAVIVENKIEIMEISY